MTALGRTSNLSAVQWKQREGRTHQVHAFAVGNDGIVRHLVFRDYMIAHPHIARLTIALDFTNDAVSSARWLEQR
jgi:GrpB-like predicted nucleotidyltransferase (UPF0157 family)